MCDIRSLTITCLEKLKALDVFGYKLTLYVDKNNYVHKTYCGAISSFLYLLFCGAIFFFLTEHAVLDLFEPLYDVNANHLSTRRRLEGANSQTVLTN